MTSSQDAYAQLRMGEKPHVTLSRLTAELSAIRELYAAPVIEKRGDMPPDPKAFQRDRVAAQVARHFNVYLETVKRPTLNGRALAARQVLMFLMAKDLRYKQIEIAEWFGTNQSAVSREVRFAEYRHAGSIEAIRGKIGMEAGR